METSSYTIGIDLGGTNLRAAAIDAAGALLHRAETHTNLSRGPEPLLQDMLDAVHSLTVQLPSAKLLGVGVAVPGCIDFENGQIVNANNLSALEGFPVRQRLEEGLQTYVILENDANAAALGERWQGAGKGVDDLILLTLGTGIGGGIVSGGQILHGFRGMAGEIGHITVVPNGNPCGCGNQGCLEKHASAQAVAVMARLSGLGEISSERCFHLAQSGDPRAQSIFQAMGQALGIALASLINIFNFPLYLLGGGALAGWDQFAPHMLAEVERRSVNFRACNTRIERARLGADAGLFGAAYLPRMVSTENR